jgi:molybdopterin synthase sulfur carrier subunit/adenylyltransferase/sulfurtransferase
MADVKLLGGLRSKVGATALKLEAGSIRALLDELVERGGQALTVLFYEDPMGDPLTPHRDLRVLVNGRSMAFLQGLDTPLEKRDKVTVHLTGTRGFPGG